MGRGRDASLRYRVRRAAAEDAGAVTRLATQLGYASQESEIGARLGIIAARRDAALFVAEDEAGTVAGWIHVYVVDLVESPRHAEIGGLVVEEARRGQGVGRLLMAAAEGWSASHGILEIALRTNVIRERAARFYLDLGYELAKTQHRMRRRLDPASPSGGAPAVGDLRQDRA